VDEYHGTPVQGGVYPIEITKKSELAEKALPYMNMGVKAMKLGNGVAGVARVFGIPAPKIPKDWIAKAENEVQLLDQDSTVAEFDILAEALDSAGGEGAEESKTLRGHALKELHTFILSKDEKGDFGGLVRICDRKNGRVIWTTEEGRTDMEAKERDALAGDEDVHSDKKQAEENSRLLEEIKALKLAAATDDGQKEVGDSELLSGNVEKLKSEIDRLKEELNHKPTDGASVQADLASAVPAQEVILLKDAAAEKDKEIESLRLRLQTVTAEASTDRASSMSSIAGPGSDGGTQEESIAKEGYVWMEGGGFLKKYRRRHFLLKGDQLWYGATASGRLVDKGRIKLTTGVKVVSTNDRDFNFSIQPPEMKDRTFNLRAESVMEKADWIAAIENVLKAL